MSRNRFEALPTLLLAATFLCTPQLAQAGWGNGATARLAKNTRKMPSFARRHAKVATQRYGKDRASSGMGYSQTARYESRLVRLRGPFNPAPMERRVVIETDARGDFALLHTALLVGGKSANLLQPLRKPQPNGRAKYERTRTIEPTGKSHPSAGPLFSERVTLWQEGRAIRYQTFTVDARGRVVADEIVAKAAP